MLQSISQKLQEVFILEVNLNEKLGLRKLGYFEECSRWSNKFIRRDKGLKDKSSLRVLKMV